MFNITRWAIIAHTTHYIPDTPKAHRQGDHDTPENLSQSITMPELTTIAYGVMQFTHHVHHRKCTTRALTNTAPPHTHSGLGYPVATHGLWSPPGRRCPRLRPGPPLGPQHVAGAAPLNPLWTRGWQCCLEAGAWYGSWMRRPPFWAAS